MYVTGRQTRILSRTCYWNVDQNKSEKNDTVTYMPLECRPKIWKGYCHVHAIGVETKSEIRIQSRTCYWSGDQK